MQGVTVIICCYNSASRLAQTLMHLATQVTTSDFELEVVLVDNMSTDGTAEIAAQIWKELNSTVALKTIKENEPGLSFARKRGIEEAKYDILIFCDDDNWLAEDYVIKAAQLMSRSIGIIGGLGQPVFENTEPGWFKYFKSFYAVGDQSKSVFNDLPNFQYVYGAGMIVNKKALLELYNDGFVSIAVDRIGNQLTSGGDTELCLALQLLGYKVVYNPTLKFEHFISSSKLRFGYCAKLVSGIGYSSDLLFPYRAYLDSNNSFPFPSFKSFKNELKQLLFSSIILILPFKRFGPFYDKFRNSNFLFGKVKFHLLNQKRFIGFNSFLSSR